MHFQYVVSRLQSKKGIVKESYRGKPLQQRSREKREGDTPFKVTQGPASSQHTHLLTSSAYHSTDEYEPMNQSQETINLSLNILLLNLKRFVPISFFFVCVPISLCKMHLVQSKSCQSLTVPGDSFLVGSEWLRALFSNENFIVLSPWGLGI